MHSNDTVFALAAGMAHCHMLTEEWRYVRRKVSLKIPGYHSYLMIISLKKSDSKMDNKCARILAIERRLCRTVRRDGD